MGSFVTDNFNGSEGDALETYQPDWTRHGSYYGYAEIAANRVRPASTSSPCYYRTATPPAADYEVIADVHIATDSGNYIADVCGRINTSAKTMYLASCYGSAASGGWRLRKVVAGTVTQLGTTVTSPTRSAGSTYRLKLKMSGDQISLYVDGALVIGPITDTAITAAGKAGIQFYSAASPSGTVGYHLDNFDATDGVSGATYTETLTDTAVTLATLADLAARVESLQTVIQSGTAATDTLLSGAIEDILTIAAASATETDAQTMRETLFALAQAGASVAELGAFIERALITAAVTASVSDAIIGAFTGVYVRGATVAARTFSGCVRPRSFRQEVRPCPC